MPLSWFRCWKIAMTSTPVRESRLPVGSSARRMAGRLTRARAIATRCCWPPDNWFGKWSVRSPKPRWVDRRHIADVLAEIPAGSVTRARLDLMHWTGMRPSQMGRLRAEDFRLDEPIPYVAVPRGKGGRIAAVPLVPEGVDAARAFLDAEAFGPWPRSSVNRALAAAARRAGRDVFTTNQIRHSFAAGLRRAGTDVADIQDLYGHTRPETTMIYAPPELAKHRAALERLRRDDATGAPFPAGRPVLAGTDGWQSEAGAS